MKVKELIEELKGQDPEKEVGGSGHFGEILEIYGVYEINDLGRDFVEIQIESPGLEPE